jgi:hypothetical protein
METTKTQTNVFSFVLTCMLNDFLEEICVAGGTVLVFSFARLRTTPV